MNLLDLAVKITCKDEATSKIGGIASGIKDTLGGAAKAAAVGLTAATAAVGAGIVAIGKQAFDAYSEYEQLSGGISKLFGAAGQSLQEYADSTGQSVDAVKEKYYQLREAESAVEENATRAFETAGMSINQYMETATGFAASLTNSLGGDTVKAAEQADKAIRAISDNYNTFGGDIENVKNAFNGFARQNFMMLDNLHLGYQGSRSEMERLIADANEYARSIGEASDLSIDNFSDIVTAIDLIQQKQNIAGTTARESAKTIEGSLNAVKAAWANLVASFGKDGEDIGARVKDLMDSLFGKEGTVGEGLVANVSETVRRIGVSIVGALPQIVSSATRAVGEIGGPILEMLVETFGKIGEMVGEMILNVDWDKVHDDIVNGVSGAANAAIDWLKNVDWEQAWTTLVESLGFIGRTITDTLAAIDWGTLATEVGDGLLTAINGGIDLLEETDWDETFSTVRDGIGEAFRNIGDFLGEIDWDGLATAAANMVNGFADAIKETDWHEVYQGLKDGYEKVMEELEVFLESVDWEGLLTGLLTGLGTVLNDLIDDIFMEFGIDLQQMDKDIEEFINDPIGTLERGAADITRAAGDFFKGLVDEAGKAASNALDELGKGITDICNDISGAVDRMLNAAKEFFQGFPDGVKQKGSEAVDWVKGLPNRIVSALGDLGGLLVNAGRSILNGLWSGMQSVWNDLTGWVSGLGKWIADHKGPLDYDRKLLVNNGKAIMQGLDSGLKQGWKGVQQTVDGMTMELSNVKFGVGFETMQAIPQQGDTYIFNQPYKNPYEVGREIRMTKTYGLAGSRR